MRNGDGHLGLRARGRERHAWGPHRASRRGPGGQPRRGARSPRTQRRRQEHASQGAGGFAAISKARSRSASRRGLSFARTGRSEFPTCRNAACFARRCRSRRWSRSAATFTAAASAACRRTTEKPSTTRSKPHMPMSCAIASLPSCRSESSNACCSPVRSPRTHPFCCSTNRLLRSTWAKAWRFYV